MYIEQLYTNCLAEAAYYIESNGEAAIIDPIRETEPYINLANHRKAKIKWIFETHFHADFVSGHIDLAKKTGAAIVFGPTAKAQFDILVAEDGEEFTLGNIKIKAIHTPGHTPESTCFLVIDEEGEKHAVFSGDTLFVGDVGRPDLLDGVIISKEEQVSNLYDSLNNKIKTLPDHVVVYPAHGPGSMCGKSIGKETQSTIGKEKQHNYALQEMSREEFSKMVLEGQIPAPKYFVKNAIINRTGYENIDTLLERDLKALNVNQLEEEIKNGALVLDTRKSAEFAKEYIKGAWGIDLAGSFAVWAGTLIDLKQRIVLVTEHGKERESVLRLARVGFDNIAGYLEGGIDAWKNASKETDKINSIDVVEFAKRENSDHTEVIDVRKVSEWEQGHVKGAILLPLRDLENNLPKLDSNKDYFVHCAAGYRSVIACSILKSRGFHHILNVEGGFEKIKLTETPLESGDFVNVI